MSGRSPSGTTAVISAAAALGQPHAGTARSPFHLLSAGLSEICSSQDAKVVQRVVAPVGSLGRFCRELAEATLSHARAGDLVICCGGDHAVSLGSIPGMARTFPELRVLWIDAHADFNTPTTSPSGNPHGMPLAGLTGAFSPHAAWGSDFAWMGAPLPAQRFALVGVRDLDAQEASALKASGIWHRNAAACLRAGADSLAAAICQGLGLGASTPLHVSFDVDALDPSVAPHTGTPVPGGFGAGFVPALLRAIAARGVPIVGLDLVEVNLDLGPSSTGVSSTVAECLATVAEVVQARARSGGALSHSA